MAEELMELVNNEEYVDLVQMFGGTDYLNKTEVTALKKMVSGKLWLDYRKFINRQNQSITSGMFSLFGLTVGKSATVVHAEVCDHFLSPDNNSLREKVRSSFKAAGKSYSCWISNMTSENTPCNEFYLYVLCHTYKRHVVVLLSTKIWCSFKPGTMTTFEKINKADHVLVWLGEDRFSEIKPLQIKSGIGNVLEWQLLAEAINHTHEKRLSAQKPVRRPDRATDTTTVKLIVDISMSPTRTRTGRKRDSKITIDYKQYHADGVRVAKSPYKEKPLPRASGLSSTRLSAQQMIIQQKLNSPKSKKPDRHVSVKTEAGNTVLPNNQALVKPEPGIFMRHRHSKADENKVWNYVHRSGKPCPSGADGTCKHKKRDDNELPDIPTTPNETTTQSNKRTTDLSGSMDVRSGVTPTPPTTLNEPGTDPRSVVTDPDVNTTPETPLVLISPPPIERRSASQTASLNQGKPKNLGDLLCTLNFDVQPGKEIATLRGRSVVTDDPNVRQDPPPTLNKRHTGTDNEASPARSVRTEGSNEPQNAPATPHHCRTISNSHVSPARAVLTNNSSTEGHAKVDSALLDMQSDEFLPDLVVDQAQ